MFQKKSPKKLCDEVTSQSEASSEPLSEKGESMDTQSTTIGQTDETSSAEKNEKPGEVEDSNVNLTSDRTMNDSSASEPQGKSQNKENVTVLHLTDEVKSENSEMCNDTGNNIESGMQRTTRTALKNCDKTSNSGINSVQLSDLDTAKTRKQINSEQSTHSDTKTDKPKTDKDSPTKTHASTVCGVPVIANKQNKIMPYYWVDSSENNRGSSDSNEGPVDSNENNGEPVEKSSGKESPVANSMTRCDSSVQISDSSANNVDHCEKDTSANIDSCKKDSTADNNNQCKKEEANKVIPVKHKGGHVHFSDQREEKKISEPEHPKDLLEIQTKMKDGYYASVVSE